MPTKEHALLELEYVFDIIAAEYREKGLPLRLDTAKIANAWCSGDEYGRAALA